MGSLDARAQVEPADGGVGAVDRGVASDAEPDAATPLDADVVDSGPPAERRRAFELPIPPL